MTEIFFLNFISSFQKKKKQFWNKKKEKENT
jgi:hypothetical protein